MSSLSVSRRALLTLAVLALSALIPGVAQAAQNYIIQVNGTMPGNLAQMVSAAGGTLHRVHNGFGVAQATSNDPAFAAKLATASGIKSVTADSIVQWTPVPNVDLGHALALPQGATAPPNPAGAQFFSCQWALQQIDAPGAWAAGQFGSPHVKVAVLDTGTDPSHIDLAGKIDLAQSTSKLTAGSSPCGSFDETTIFDLDFHGTFVSSMITGNGLGIAAVAPNSHVVAVKVLNCAGSGSFGDVIAGIDYAAGLPDVKVINMSLGAYIPVKGNEAVIQATQQAILFAANHGKLVVSAAGNDGVDLPADPTMINVPGELPGGIGIFATTIDETLASYSNHGFPPFTWTGAPGGDLPNDHAPLAGCVIDPTLQSLILGACSSFVCGGPNFYVLAAGTSFSSPITAAAAELFDAQHPALSQPLTVAAVLAATATHLTPIDSFSLGVLNAARVVKLIPH